MPLTTIVLAAFLAAAPAEKVLRVVIAGPARPPARLAEDLVAEAAAIWGPYGLVIRAGDDRTAREVVTVTFVNGALVSSAADHAAWATPLGKIGFLTDGHARTDIYISASAVERLLEAANSPGRADPPWPLVRDRVLARAFGRVLAHEIGHYVLRFPAHTPSGLMAARQLSAALGGSDRGPFTLTPLLEPRLRYLLARTKSGLDGGDR